MIDANKPVTQLIKYSRVYLLFLGVSLLFFAFKGITYALIGSFAPLLLITIILILFIFTSKKSSRALKRMMVFWAVLLLLWSSSRLLLSIVNLLVKPIPEAHVHAQLGIEGVVLSLFFLFIAMYLLKFKNGMSLNEVQ